MSEEWVDPPYPVPLVGMGGKRNRRRIKSAAWRLSRMTGMLPADVVFLMRHRPEGAYQFTLSAEVGRDRNRARRVANQLLRLFKVADGIQVHVECNAGDRLSEYRFSFRGVVIAADAMLAPAAVFWDCFVGEAETLAAELAAGTLKPFTRNFYGDCTGREAGSQGSGLNLVWESCAA